MSPHRKKTLETIDMARIRPNPHQPRRFFETGKLDELAASIRTNGLLQPILVRPFGKDFQIVAGERRFQACKKLGLNAIPAIIQSLDEQETRFAALVENLQREDLNPVEEAEAVWEMLMTTGFTHEQLAVHLGRSRSALTNLLRILQLPADVRSRIASGEISAGHAKMLAGLKDPKEVRWWMKRIIREDLSVYETEKQIAREKQTASENESGKSKSAKGKGTMSPDVHVRQVEENLQEVLGAKVRIRQGKARGTIEIEFYDREDLQRVVESMMVIRRS